MMMTLSKVSAFMDKQSAALQASSVSPPSCRSVSPPDQTVFTNETTECLPMVLSKGRG